MKFLRWLFGCSRQERAPRSKPWPFLHGSDFLCKE